MNKNFSLPKGNWSKVLKIVPSNFNETYITEHHCNSLAKKHLTLGYRMFKANKVSQVFLSPGSKSDATSEVSSERYIYIKSVVEASFTISTKYEVAIKMKGSGRVDKAWCGCKAGSCGVCKHVGSVLWFVLDCLREARTFVPDDISCTDKARTWSAPNENRKINKKTFADLDFVKHVPGKCSEGLKVRQRNQQNYSVLDEVGMLEDENNMQNRIKQVTERLTAGKRRSFFCLLQEENNFTPARKPSSLFENSNDKSTNQVPSDKDLTIRISLPVAVLEIDGKIKDLIKEAIFKIPDNLKLTLNASIILEVETREQSNCLLWKSERKYRITASKFGSICKRQKEVNETFLKTIFNGADLSRNKYVQEGLKNENLATEKYQNIHPGVKTFSVGLCVNPTLPMFGASPDRLVHQENIGYGLLEIKTLAKCKEKGMSIDEAIGKKEATTRFLKKDENSEIYLDQKHAYYYQVQGQLGLTSLKWCDFLVDIGDDKPFCQRINFNEKFFNETMVPILVNFYMNHGLPFLQKQM